MREFVSMTISTATRRAGIILSMGWLAAVSIGCTPPPATDKQDILDTIRNGAVGAEVRRLDDAPHAYVQGIFKANNRWGTASAPLLGIADIDHLWKLDGPEWRDSTKVKERADIVTAWVADTPVEFDDGRLKLTRGEILAEFDAALTADPGAPGATAGELAPQVRGFVDPHAAEADTAALARTYQELLSLVIANADKFDPKASGLAFTEESVTTEAKGLWQQLHDRFTAERQAQREGIEKRLNEGKVERDLLVEEKQNLLATKPTAEADVRKLRKLELDIKYHDALIKSAEGAQKRLALKDAAEKG
jgi:hypothetical protein